MARAQNVYEGTDSEGEELETKPVIVPRAPEIVSHPQSSEWAPLPQKSPNPNRNPKPFKPFDLGYSPKIGELSRDDERFCTFHLVKSYPYHYIGKANRQRVDDTYFNQGKIYDNSWELFYLYRDLLEGSPPPLVLVTTRQFVHFLARINNHLNTKLSIPDGSKGAFEVLFGEKGTPRPRYLGQINSKLTMDNLVYKMPLRNYKLDDEPEISYVVTEEFLEVFQRKVTVAQQKQQKKAATKEKSIKNRNNNQKSWRQITKRVQRYLGIRQAKINHLCPEQTTSLSKLDDNQKPVTVATEKLASTVLFDSLVAASFTPENSVVFVCVDVEAYERDSRIITEIGFATLDTQDILSKPPGVRGADWQGFIRPRHFRITENKFYNNTDYVAGCADRFEFGTSEFISIKDVPEILSDCFKYPTCRKGENVTNEQAERKVVFVGHDVNSDIKFLRTVGYDVYSLPNLFDIIDTALMYRSLKREMNTRSLGAILTDMGIVGWNLHNAGNDAVYTLQAMIAVAIKHLEERQKLLQAGISGHTKKRSDPIHERGEAWSSSEDSDGGSPNIIFPVPSEQTYEKRNKKSHFPNPQPGGPRNSWSNVDRRSSNYEASGSYNQSQW